MARRDQPYIPLYVQDFLTDEKLVECSAEAHGVYIRLMCLMHKSSEYGKILLKQKDKQNESNILNFACKLDRQMPFSVDVIERSLTELLEEGVLTMEGDALFQKRMVRDGKLSDTRAAAGSKGGKKGSAKSKSENFATDFAIAKSQANTENEIEIEGELINDLATIENNGTITAEYIENKTGIKTYIGNDANVAAFGEYVAGSAKGANIAVMITLGTGVGAGIVIDGKIYTGFNFAGAEIGHTVIEVDGASCTCGRKGCFEAYSSATGLIRMTKEEMDKSPDSLMHKLSEETGHVSGRTAFDAAKQGDEVAQRVVDKYIKYLAAGVTNTINIFQPDIFSIGGGVAGEGDNLLIPLKEIVEKEVYSRNSPKNTEIVIASLGNDAGIIGAALLGMNAL